MWALIDKIHKIEEEWSLRKGPFILFTVIIRENAPAGRWEIVLSAPWITNEKSFLDEFIPALRQSLSEDNLKGLSRIVVLDPDEPFIQNFLQWFKPGEFVTELQDAVVNGIPIKRAYLIAASNDSNVPAMTGR